MDPQPCPCSCSSCLCCGPSSSPSPSWRLSLKRKLNQIQENKNDDVTSQLSSPSSSSARVEIDTEAAALRETLGSHRTSIRSLYAELEEERSSAATAASEAMSMILRLQREKAEAQMEFRQFKRLAEEKMSHDQHEIALLEDLIFKKEEALESLNCEIQAYKQRLMTYQGSEPASPATATSPGTASAMAAAAFDYPSLSCRIRSEDRAVDLEKYAFGETPCSSSRRSHVKGVVAVSSSSPSRQARRLSGVDGEEFPLWEMEGEEVEDEESDDRVYTVDKVHCHHYPKSSCVTTPREFGKKENGGEEIKRLYMRLQALEADREAMRETILAMGKDKAQTVLLKEIAQQLGKEVILQPVVPRPVMQQQHQKKIVKKASFIRRFSIVAAMKVIFKFVRFVYVG